MSKGTILKYPLYYKIIWVPLMSIELVWIFLGWAIGKALDTFVDFIKKMTSLQLTPNWKMSIENGKKHVNNFFQLRHNWKEYMRSSKRLPLPFQIFLIF